MTVYNLPLGTRFRFERELRQISLMEISRNLKLPVSKLIDFEENRMVADHHGPYFKTFVNGYISYLGLDPETIDLEIRYHREQLSQSRIRVNQTVSTKSQNFIPIMGFIATLMALLVWIAINPSETAYPRMGIPELSADRETGSISYTSALDAIKYISDTIIQSNLTEDYFNTESLECISITQDQLISVIATSLVWIRALLPDEGKDLMQIIFPGEVQILPPRKSIYLEIGAQRNTVISITNQPAITLNSEVRRFHFITS